MKIGDKLTTIVNLKLHIDQIKHRFKCQDTDNYASSYCLFSKARAPICAQLRVIALLCTFVDNNIINVWVTKLRRLKEIIEREE